MSHVSAELIYLVLNTKHSITTYFFCEGFSSNHFINDEYTWGLNIIGQLKSSPNCLIHFKSIRDRSRKRNARAEVNSFELTIHALTKSSFNKRLLLTKISNSLKKLLHLRIESISDDTLAEDNWIPQNLPLWWETMIESTAYPIYIYFTIFIHWKWCTVLYTRPLKLLYYIIAN